VRWGLISPAKRGTGRNEKGITTKPKDKGGQLWGFGGGFSRKTAKPVEVQCARGGAKKKGRVCCPCENDKTAMISEDKTEGKIEKKRAGLDVVRKTTGKPREQRGTGPETSVMRKIRREGN